jgi:hypothetical protein
MAAYIASGDPLDKAGAYGIQHPVFRPVEALQGCYPNVMGLPLCRLAALLAEFGVPTPNREILESCGPAENRPDFSRPCRVYRLATDNEF